MIATMPFGTFDSFGDNELLLKSLKDDPSKFRFDAPGPGRWLGALSFNRNGKELGLVGMKLSEDGQRAEFVVFCYDAARPGTEDDKMGSPVLSVTPAAVPAGESAFTSPNGRFRTQYQDDGNVVTYDVSVTPWKPIWSTLTGWLGV